MTQASLGRRRGNVFAVRITDDERRALEGKHASEHGPRALGPWVIWKALDGEPGDRSGSTSPASCARCAKPASFHMRVSSGARAWLFACLDCYVDAKDLQEAHPLATCEVCPLARSSGTTSAPSRPEDLTTATRRGRPRDGSVAPDARTPYAARAARASSASAEARTVPLFASLEAVLPSPASRIILDLCAGSGAWSAPYAAAGYDVRKVSLPEIDVRTYVPPPNVWGVLAAPPCTEFSLAKNGYPRDFGKGMDVVSACMRVVLQARPRWWALENPVGYLGDFLGAPHDTWEPFEFGDPWTKRTAIWGAFALPKRGPFVKPKGGGPLCTACDPARRRSTWCSNAAHRAITPAGFARAFFEANA